MKSTRSTRSPRSAKVTPAANGTRDVDNEPDNIRSPDEYRREILAGPHAAQGFEQVQVDVDHDLEWVLQESMQLHERRQQRIAEFAPLLSKLKRLGFYDMLVQKEYEHIVSWCEAYYEDRPSSIKVSFEALTLIRWTLSERAALDKIKHSHMV